LVGRNTWLKNIEGTTRFLDVSVNISKKIYMKLIWKKRAHTSQIEIYKIFPRITMSYLEQSITENDLGGVLEIYISF
jgi:hypothetical protein